MPVSARRVRCGDCGYVMSDFGKVVMIYPAMSSWPCPGCQTVYCSQCEGDVEEEDLVLEDCGVFSWRESV